MTLTPDTAKALEPGAPCSFSVGSDRYPGNIIGVSPSGKTLTVQDADYAAVGGPYEYGDHIEYEYEPNPDGRVGRYTWRPSQGCYRLVSHTSTYRLSLGYGRYYDPQV